MWPANIFFLIFPSCLKGCLPLIWHLLIRNIRKPNSSSGYYFFKCVIMSNKYYFFIIRMRPLQVGRVAQSVQRLPTGWTVRRSNPGGARFSAPVQTGLEAHPASCTMCTGSFPGVRCCRGVTLNPHPLLVQRSKIEQSYTSALLKGLRGL